MSKKFIGPRRDNICSVNFVDILNDINVVHEKCTYKYTAHGWEELTSALDSDPESNINAMLRHTMKMYNGEIREPESGCMHMAHLYCRLEMLCTGLLRSFSNKKKMIPSDKVTGDLYSRHVTMEMIAVMMTIRQAAVHAVIERYVKCTTEHEVLRLYQSALLRTAAHVAEPKSGVFRDHTVTVVDKCQLLESNDDTLLICISLLLDTIAMNVVIDSFGVDEEVSEQDIEEEVSTRIAKIPPTIREIEPTSTRKESTAEFARTWHADNVTG